MGVDRRKARARRTLAKGAGAFVLGCLLVAVTPRGLQTVEANGDTRTLSFKHTHVDEQVTVTFKRDGRYDPEGLRRLNQFLRDWRRDEVAEIDPRLLDLVWEVYRDVGGREPIHLVSAYRSPTTNEMLRARSSAVARESQHTRGKAMDFFIPGVPTQTIREKGILRQRGGVGFYTGPNGFVHLDVGSVRAWPRLTREQLARLFPNGETVHLPADGRPLPGYEIAMARLRANQGGSALAFAAPAARGTTDDAPGRAEPDSGSGDGILAALFGGSRVSPPPAAGATSAPAPRAQIASANSEGSPERPRVVTARAMPVPIPLPRPSGLVETAEALAEPARPASPAPLPPPRPLALASVGNVPFASPAPQAPARALPSMAAERRAVALVAPDLSGAALRPLLAIADVRRTPVARASVAVASGFTAAPDAAPGFGAFRTARTDSFAGPAVRNLLVARAL